jgi:hypothetical protein
MGQVCKGRRAISVRGGRWYALSIYLPDKILRHSPDIVLIDLPSQRPESYAFSVPLTSVYSFLVHPPSLSSWCKLLSNFCHLSCL